MKRLLLMIVLLLAIVLLTAQIIVIPADNPQVRFEQGDNLQWYIFCENRCLQLLDATSVDVLYRGYPNVDEAIRAYQLIYVRIP